MAAKDTSNKPYVDNYPELAGWLKKHRAHCMWQKIDVAMSVEAWLIGDRIAIIQVHANRGGWDIFTPFENTEIAATFSDAEKRLGIKS